MGSDDGLERVDVHTADGCTELEARIRNQLGGQVYGFRLLVTEDNALVLRGRAHRYHAKQLAQQAVMEATEIPILANEIEVS